MKALEGSYAWCERVARDKAANFYHAFRLLPRSQRLAMCALYAFLRWSDDLADSDAPLDVRRRLLNEWRQRWQLARTGVYSHRVHAAFHHTVETFAIPAEYVDAALDGVGMDLEQTRYSTFADLYCYCYRVASVVGLACLHIWGFERSSQTLADAEAAGIAFQLTNILRDLGEDAGRGRIYLPLEDLHRFGYTERELLNGVRDERYRALMRFEAERARDFYNRAAPLIPQIHKPGRRVFAVMTGTYRALLDKIEASDFDVFARRIRVSRYYKLWLVLRSLLT